MSDEAIVNSKVASDSRELDEFDVRQYFMQADLSEALTTHAICEGIISARQAQKPQRKRRSDIGRARKVDDAPLLAFDPEDRP